MSADLVACTDCGAVFVRDEAPSRMCPVCHNDGVESGGVAGVATKHPWYEGIDA